MLIKKYGESGFHVPHCHLQTSQPTGTTTLQNRHLHDGVPPYVDLDQFVCACVAVRQIYGLYERCSAGRIEQGQIPRDEFIQAIISLP
jgi:hypothetical protein